MAVLKPKYISPSIEIGPRQVDLTQGCDIQFTVDSDEPVTQIDLEFKDSEGKISNVNIQAGDSQSSLPGYATYYIVQDHVPYYVKRSYGNARWFDNGAGEFCEYIDNNMFHPLVQNFNQNVEEKFYLPGIVFPNEVTKLSLTEMFYIHHYSVEGIRENFYMRGFGRLIGGAYED